MGPFDADLYLANIVGQWKVFWFLSTDLLHRFANHSPSRFVCIFERGLSLNPLDADLFLRLCDSETVGGQLHPIHKIQQGAFLGNYSPPKTIAGPGRAPPWRRPEAEPLGFCFVLLARFSQQADALFASA